MYQDYTVLHYQTLQLILRSVQPNLRSVQPIFKAVQPFFMPVQQFCSLVQLNFSQVKMFLMLVPFPQSGSIVFRQTDTNLMLIYSFFSGHFTSIQTTQSLLFLFQLIFNTAELSLSSNCQSSSNPTVLPFLSVSTVIFCWQTESHFRLFAVY